MRRFLSVGLVLSALAVPVCGHASPIVVLLDSQVASAVDGVVVDGVDYNVTFVAGAVDSTFNGNPTAAAEAESELIAALNSSTAAFVSLKGVGSINQFIVEDAGPYTGPEATSFSAPNGWQTYGTGTYDGSVAVFTPVPAPEPSSFLLLGTGVLGVAGIARRRFSRVQSGPVAHS